MFRKIWSIFMRDVKVNKRDFIALYILIAPLLFAFGIQALAPSVWNNSPWLKFSLIYRP